MLSHSQRRKIHHRRKCDKTITVERCVDDCWVCQVPGVYSTRRSLLSSLKGFPISLMTPESDFTSRANASCVCFVCSWCLKSSLYASLLWLGTLQSLLPSPDRTPSSAAMLQDSQSGRLLRLRLSLMPYSADVPGRWQSRKCLLSPL